MIYSDKNIKDIRRFISKLDDTYMALFVAITDLRTKLKNEDAIEHLMQGVARRLKILTRCTNNIFRLFPVEQSELLHEDDLLDLDINLHAFFLNISGVLDNLAWVLVYEHDLFGDSKDGKIAKHGVGLFKRNTQVYLMPALKRYILSEELQAWHKTYSKDYRDALTHRIPLYVPPSMLNESEQLKYNEFAEQYWAFSSVEKIPDQDEILNKQSQLGVACPFFAHSFREGCKPVVMHAQVVADYRTLEKLIKLFCEGF